MALALRWVKLFHTHPHLSHQEPHTRSHRYSPAALRPAALRIHTPPIEHPTRSAPLFVPRHYPHEISPTTPT